MKKALIVGIDDYPSCPLSGCINDANSVARVLSKNGDGSPNFDTKVLTSDECLVDCETLLTSIEELFKGEAEIALLYFSGHGLINLETNMGHIVSQDGKKGAYGVSLSEILSCANNASPEIKSSVIILDCCQSGGMGEMPSASKEQISSIGNGVTILTACHREELALEVDDQGLFTSILLDGLEGGSADICGRITPASVYSHIDQTLGPWEQRPIYKANVRTFITLREVSPKVPLEILRRLPEYFKSPSDHLVLDPSFEPDRKNIPEEYRHLPVNEENIKTFKELQLCNRHGLVVPVGAEHMYYAAINSTSCKLTALGAHFRNLADLQRI